MAVTRAAPSDVSRIAVLGASLKMEVVELQPTSGTAVQNTDTFESRLANPQFGFVFPNGANAGAAILALATAANDKTVTIHIEGGSLESDLNVVAVVFGR